MSVLSDLASAASVLAFPLVGWWVGLDFTWVLILAIIGASLDPAGYTARKSLLVDAARAGDVRLDTLNGIHEALFAAGWTLGPLIGAALITTVGAVDAFWVPGAMFVVAAACVAAMRVRDAGREAVEQGAEEATGWRGLTRGFAALNADRALRGLTIAVMVLAGVYLPTESILLPVHFESLGQPEGLGIVIAALAGGSVLGSLSYGWLSARQTKVQIIRLALAGTALAMVPMALLPGLPLLVAAALVLGLSWGPMQPLLNTVVQERIPAQEQGRVFSVQLTAFYVFPPVAMLLTGVASERWGVSVIYPVLAALVIIVGAVALSSASIRSLK
jgi:predicted MFS family arabinose efflux permease